MRVPVFLADLRERDIRVWADGDRLRCSAPAGSLTPELRDQLRERKADILRFLQTREAIASQQRAIVPLQPHGSRTPIFGVGGHNGDVFCYRSLAKHLGNDQPLFGLQPPGFGGEGEPLTRVEELGAYFAAQIRAFRPQGPCVIAGYCAGGTIAFELARQLLDRGVTIPFLALFGAPYPTRFRWRTILQDRLEQEMLRAGRHLRTLASLSLQQWKSYVLDKARGRKARLAVETRNPDDPVVALRAKIERATLAAGRRYKPGHLRARVHMFLPSRAWAESCNEPLRWRSHADEVEIDFGPEGCGTENMLREPHAATFAELYKARSSGA